MGYYEKSSLLSSSNVHNLSQKTLTNVYLLQILRQHGCVQIVLQHRHYCQRLQRRREVQHMQIVVVPQLLIGPGQRVVDFAWTRGGTLHDRAIISKLIHIIHICKN